MELVCPNCTAKLNDFCRGNYKGRYFNPILQTVSFRCFCTKECYENYKEQFVVDIHNNQPIYCIETNGAKRYMPYFESDYYFTNIDDCKQRMDMKNVSVVSFGCLRF